MFFVARILPESVGKYGSVKASRLEHSHLHKMFYIFLQIKIFTLKCYIEDQEQICLYYY